MFFVLFFYFGVGGQVWDILKVIPKRLFRPQWLLTSLADMLLSGFPFMAGDVGEEKKASGAKLA